MPADPFVVAKATSDVRGRVEDADRGDRGNQSGRWPDRDRRRQRQDERQRRRRAARGDDRPRDAAVRGRVEPDDEEPERRARRPARGPTPAASGVRPPAPGSRASSTMPPSTRGDAGPLGRRGGVAPTEVDGERDDRARRRDRRDDPHRTDRHPAVERREARSRRMRPRRPRAGDRRHPALRRRTRASHTTRAAEARSPGRARAP